MFLSVPMKGVVGEGLTIKQNKKYSWGVVNKGLINIFCFLTPTEVVVSETKVTKTCHQSC